MQGSVLHYDDNVGTGQISGDDGIRYNFTRADIKRLMPLRAGSRVDFDPEDKWARDIFVVAGPGVPGVRAGVPLYSGPADPDLGLFGYFKQCFSKKYASFYGRARRKEYWGFVLFNTLIWIAAGIVIAIGVGNTNQGSSPNVVAVIGIVVLIGFMLAGILPSISVTVRRFHDIGQSGWIVLLFYVLSVIPYVNFVSGIAWLVMLCLDTQPQENQYGPPAKPVA